MESSKNLNRQVIRVVYITILLLSLIMFWQQFSSNSDNNSRDGWKLIGTVLLIDIVLIPLTFYSFRMNRLKIPSFIFFLFVNSIALSGGGPHYKYIYLIIACLALLIAQLFTSTKSQ
jgi:hypothetical protein